MRNRARTTVIGLLVAGTAMAGVGSAASAAPPDSPHTPAAATAGKPPKGGEVRWVLQLRYRITKPCKIYLNHPGHTAGSNKSWTLPYSKGATVKWRYNASSRWAVISVGGHGYPHWGFTDRTKANTCLGTSIRQVATVRMDHKTGKWTIPVSYYPAGRATPARIGRGRSNHTTSHWRRVDQRPAAARITHRKVKLDENATLRDEAGFVLGNVPKRWHVNVTAVTHSNGFWTKVEVPKLHSWGFIRTRALPRRLARHSAPAPTAPRAAASSAMASAAPAGPATPGTVCHWKVIWPAAGVYPAPDRTGAPLKTKHNGDIVGQSCTTIPNPTDHETYVQVNLAEGGTGWMRRNALHPA
jgi:hypothetical protein